MADRRIIVISELAPRLKNLKPVQVREFLSEYFSYQNRTDESEMVSAMRSLINPHDLDTLVMCFRPDWWCRLVKKRLTTNVVSERERRRAELQTPMTPSVLASSFDEEVVSEVKAEKKESVKFESVGSEKLAEERFEVKPKGLDPQGTASLRSDVGDLVTDLEDPLLVVGGDRMGLPNIVPLSNAHIELMLV